MLASLIFVISRLWILWTASDAQRLITMLTILLTYNTVPHRMTFMLATIWYNLIAEMRVNPLWLLLTIISCIRYKSSSIILASVIPIILIYVFSMYN